MAVRKGALAYLATFAAGVAAVHLWYAWIDGRLGWRIGYRVTRDDLELWLERDPTGGAPE